MTNEEGVRRHLHIAWKRAEESRAQARAIRDAGFGAAAYVWAVRSAELLMREYVLAPIYLEQGHSWSEAMKQGSAVLGSGNWQSAFKAAERRYGPFDTPLTGAGEHAWHYWTRVHVKIRNSLVHGLAVPDPPDELVEEVLFNADRMATWYSQRFHVTDRHPIGREFREVLAALPPPDASTH